MSDIDDKIKARIKKLLALASSSNEHEASTAMRQAMKLMAKHNVSESQLASEKIENQSFHPDYKVIPQWAAILYLGICEALGVYATYKNRWYSEPSEVVLCGKNSDIEKALYILTVSKELILRQSRNFHKDNNWLGRKEMNDYKKGLSYGFTERLQQEYSIVEKEMSEGKGLVPVDTRYSDAKDAYLADNKVRSVAVNSGLYTMHGRADSHLIDVKDPIRDSSVKGRLAG